LTSVCRRCSVSTSFVLAALRVLHVDASGPPAWGGRDRGRPGCGGAGSDRRRAGAGRGGPAGLDRRAGHRGRPRGRGRGGLPARAGDAPDRGPASRRRQDRRPRRLRDRRGRRFHAAPAWPQSPAAQDPPSAASTHPTAATSTSSGPCSCPRSPPCTTPPPGPTTTANAPKANATTPSSSAWPAAGSTSCSRCSRTAHSTRTAPEQLLDATHRDTSAPRRAGAASARQESGLTPDGVHVVG
jgi:hypothetical protein